MNLNDFQNYKGFNNINKSNKHIISKEKVKLCGLINNCKEYTIDIINNNKNIDFNDFINLDNNFYDIVNLKLNYFDSNKSNIDNESTDNSSDNSTDSTNTIYYSEDTYDTYDTYNSYNNNSLKKSTINQTNLFNKTKPRYCQKSNQSQNENIFRMDFDIDTDIIISIIFLVIILLFYFSKK